MVACFLKLGAAHIAAIGKSKSHDSGRRWLQAPVRQDVGLNPTADVPECQRLLHMKACLHGSPRGNQIQ